MQKGGAIREFDGGEVRVRVMLKYVARAMQ